MSIIFTPGKIGTLELPNRLVRSATAECMADEEGRPLPKLIEFYKELARGGVGLIITGHMYIHPSGKAHPEMTGIYKDELIPDLTKLANAAHQENGRVVVQINHGGMYCDKETVSGSIAPSAIDLENLEQPAREMTLEELKGLIDAYAQAARRAKEAGFDGVQIHGAHGYLNSQFLSPFVNKRTDKYGGDIQSRMTFLREVCQAARDQVGQDYPLFIKLGMQDGIEGGLSLEEGAEVVKALQDMGLDGVELSGGIGGEDFSNTKKGIRKEENEAYFLPFAKKAKQATLLPVILVGGFRSKSVMEKVLQNSDADFISMCRPLITEPNFPNMLRDGIKDKSRCLSSNNCWPEEIGVGIACKCPLDKLPASPE
jgi:2,4-dienoyl-CoA reductase-like NADH-dependent reductase (Old Yellow Enzyme family)